MTKDKLTKIIDSGYHSKRSSKPDGLFSGKKSPKIMVNSQVIVKKIQYARYIL